MKIFEVAVLYVPQEKKDQEPADKAKLLVPPTAIVAKNDVAAQIVASRMIPSEYEDRLEQVQVAVRPF